MDWGSGKPANGRWRLMSYRPPARRSRKSLAGKHHAHGCSNGRCRQRYMDACLEPNEDGLCHDCRGTASRPLWVTNSDPVDCCREHSRLATKDELDGYALAGACTWYRCRKCSRTHPFNPIREKEDG